MRGQVPPLLGLLSPPGWGEGCIRLHDGVGIRGGTVSPICLTRVGCVTGQVSWGDGPSPTCVAEKFITGQVPPSAVSRHWPGEREVHTQVNNGGVLGRTVSRQFCVTERGVRNGSGLLGGRSLASCVEREVHDEWGISFGVFSRHWVNREAPSVGGFLWGCPFPTGVGRGFCFDHQRKRTPAVVAQLLSTMKPLAWLPPSLLYSVPM